jgi:hypothetical protein
MIRICTIDVPLFRHGGLEVGEAWAPLDVAALAPAARAALVRHTGRLIRIHPHDVSKLAQLGLELSGKQLVELGAAAEAPPAPRPPDPDRRSGRRP